MFGIDPKFCMNAYLVVRDNRYYCHFQTYLPPVIVGSGEQQEDLAFLHPDLLAVLGDVLEVVVDDDEHLPVPILHPDPHRVLLLASVTHVTCHVISAILLCHVSRVTRLTSCSHHDVQTIISDYSITKYSRWTRLQSSATEA